MVVELPTHRANSDSSGEEPMDLEQPSPDGDAGSRMRRESQVRFCESVGVKFPRATLRMVFLWKTDDAGT